ncbi:hypothetical protein Tco_0681604 [Tanacetum coccineum]|uniref:Xylulose kinase-1 n=1 Tax=Tanacetum coccineum TaxID=301880 RepID=A0ABQ4XPZ6_9ASTR
MVALKFVDSHNMVAFLQKPVESDGFEQIVDFLNAHTIKYALTINPTIYTSCIEQFWATRKAKLSFGSSVARLSLVSGKKVIVTESSVRRDLQLEDAEGVDCLPNAAIFKQLALMGMVKNVDSMGKFLMYPRFVQVFLDQQVGDMSIHDKIYVTPSHIKKVFGNMKRVGKGISRNITPLFPTMMVQAHEEIGEGSVNPTDPHRTPTITQPSSSQPQKKQKPRKPRKDTQMDDSLVRAATTASSLEAEQDIGNIAKTQSKATLNEPSSIGTNLGVNTPRSGEDSMQLKELMDLCTNLQNRVLALETTKTTQALEIDSLKRRVKKLEKKDNKRTHKLKRLYKVGLSAKVVSPDDEDEDITLASTHVDADTYMFGVHYLDGDEVFVENVDASAIKKVEQNEKVVETEVAAVKDVNLSVNEVTLAQQAPTPTPIVSSQQPSHDKGKGKMVEEEPVKKFSKKDQLRLDEEFGFKLQAEEEEERLAREKAQKVQEANIA